MPATMKKPKWPGMDQANDVVHIVTDPYAKPIVTLCGLEVDPDEEVPQEPEAATCERCKLFWAAT